MIERKVYEINGNYLSVLECGNPSNPAIVFLHGIPASAELWRSIMLALSGKGFYCLAPDLPGYGETVLIKDESYTLTKSSELIAEFLKHKKLENIKLVCHDIGGGIGQILVTKHEDLFQKLILSNCVTGKSWPIKSVQKMIKASKLGLFYWLAIFGKFKRDKLYNALSKSFFRDKLSENDFDRIFYDGKFHKSERIKKFQRMLKVLHNSHTSENMSSLTKVKIPVDLIWAMNDKFQPWEKSGQEIKSRITHSEFFPIQNCGHFLQIDATEEYASLIHKRLT